MALRRTLDRIDESEPADRTLALAGRSAGGGTLIPVSAISDPVTVAPTPVAGLEMLLEAAPQGAERDLAERAPRPREAAVEVETVVGSDRRRAGGGGRGASFRPGDGSQHREGSSPARVSRKCQHPAASRFPESAPRRSLIPFAVVPCKVRNPWLPGLS